MTTLDESMSEDAVSRDAVLDACSQSINILDAMSRIEDLPPVTPQPKTGYWISVSFGDYCSECNHYYPCASYSGYEFHYCPNCGAKMEDKCIKCANNGMIDDECACCTNHNLFKESEEQA